MTAQTQYTLIEDDIITFPTRHPTRTKNKKQGKGKEKTNQILQKQKHLKTVDFFLFFLLPSNRRLIAWLLLLANCAHFAQLVIPVRMVQNHDHRKQGA